MTPRDFADAWDTSAPGPVFTTKYERAVWINAWCGTCSKSTDGGQGCALSDVAFCDRVPAAWTQIDGGTAANRYVCGHWTPAAGYLFLETELEADS